MPHVSAKLPPDLHLQIVDRVRGGAKAFDLGFELGVAPGTVTKWTAHLPHADKRDLVRASIIERAERGDDISTIASLENCSVSFVARILRSWWGEFDACERLSAMWCPRRRSEKRGRS